MCLSDFLINGTIQFKVLCVTRPSLAILSIVGVATSDYRFFNVRGVEPSLLSNHYIWALVSVWAFLVSKIPSAIFYIVHMLRTRSKNANCQGPSVSIDDTLVGLQLY